MRKRPLALFIVMLFILPTALSFVTIPGTLKLHNETVLSYEEKQTKHTACGGSRDSGPFTDGDYWDTWEDDASYLEVDSSYYMGILLVFNITESRPIGEISIFLRWQVVLQGGGPNPTLYWVIWNYDTATYDTVYSFVLETTLNFEDREESITYDEKYVNSTNHVRFYVYSSNTYADDITVDYAYLTVTKGYDGEYRETLPDDVLYYPDPLRHTACGGSEDSDPFIDGDYWDTWEDDASYLEVDSSYSVGIYLVFNITEYANFIVDNATLSIFLRWQVVLQGGGDVPELYWELYNFDTATYDTVYSFVLETTLNFERREESITYDEKYVNSTNHVQLLVYANSTYADDITVDYAYITATNEYTESFADISDWAEYGISAEDTVSTDGDVLSIEAFGNGADDYDGVLQDLDLNYTEGWNYEIRFRQNLSAANYDLTYLSIYDTTGETTGNIHIRLDSMVGVDTWFTYKGIWEYDNVDDVYIRPRVDADEKLLFQVDYFKIGDYDEMGWQHDCSTPEGVSSGAGGSFSSDGDMINCSSTADGREFRFDFDATDTAALSEGDYYQFLEISIGQVSDGDGDNLVWQPRITDGSTYEYLAEKQGSAGVFRYNVKVSTVPDIKYIYLYIDSSLDWFTVDYVKLYSIGNYTVTQSSTTTDDVLYVEDGTLQSNMDDGYFILDYDPTFLLDGSYSWTKHTTLGESYLSFYHGGWTSYSNETTGNLYVGTTTGLRIKFNETANILKIEYSVLPPRWNLAGTAIIYFYVPNWWVIGIADSIFYIPIGQHTIDFMLMLMGLVMIPFSTIFLVKGGKDEMSRAKIFLFLMIFLMGWALFLGGLM